MQHDEVQPGDIVQLKSLLERIRINLGREE